MATGVSLPFAASAAGIRPDDGSKDHLLKGLQELLDRQAIADAFLRYTRGIDRLDVEMIKSAFHPDAIDNHTKTVRGSIDEMLAWWLPQQPEREATQHFTTNQTIDLDGDVAHVETYFFVIIKHWDTETATFSGGRYADRFEKREGDWRIALRVVLSEWVTEADAHLTSQLGDIVIGLSARDRTDPTYQRPLVNPPPDS